MAKTIIRFIIAVLVTGICGYYGIYGAIKYRESHIAKTTKTSPKLFGNKITLVTNDKGDVNITCSNCNWADKVVQESFDEGVVITQSKDWVYIFGTIVNDEEPGMYYVNTKSNGELSFFDSNVYKSTHWAIRETPEGLRARFVSKYEFGEEVIRPNGVTVRVWVDNPDHSKYSDNAFNAYIEGITGHKSVGGSPSLITRKDGTVYNPNNDSVVE